MAEDEIIQYINKDLGIDLPVCTGMAELRQQLAKYINDLIKRDFQKLVSYLYRIDVNENKLKNLLKQLPDEDAGNIIASLIIERQLQKIKTKMEFSSGTEDTKEEKW